MSGVLSTSKEMSLLGICICEFGAESWRCWQTGRDESGKPGQRKHSRVRKGMRKVL